MLLEKDLAAQDTLNRQLIDELAGHVQALDQANVALQEAQRRLLSEGEQERKHLARELARPGHSGSFGRQLPARKY